MNAPCCERLREYLRACYSPLWSEAFKEKVDEALAAPCTCDYEALMAAELDRILRAQQERAEAACRATTALSPGASQSDPESAPTPRSYGDVREDELTNPTPRNVDAPAKPPAFSCTLPVMLHKGDYAAQSNPEPAPTPRTDAIFGVGRLAPQLDYMRDKVLDLERELAEAKDTIDMMTGQLQASRERVDVLKAEREAQSKSILVRENMSAARWLWMQANRRWK